ncbi:MAG: hypothetical protein WBD74_15445 [Candidatus Aquilonibacter sp.]
MITKNPFARAAYMYSGSPWLLWMSAASSTVVTPLLLFPQHSEFAWTRWVGALSALVTLYYYGAIVYLITHRTQLAANPAKPISYSWKQWVWIIAITLAVIAVFVALVQFVWPS